MNGASELEHRNEPQKKMEAEACTGSTMEAALGVKLCGRAEFPVSDQTYRSPMYPFSGNAEVSLRLVKTDPTLTSYDFESSWTNTKVPTFQSLLKVNMEALQSRLVARDSKRSVRVVKLRNFARKFCSETCL